MVGLAARSLAGLDEDVTLPQYRALVVLASRGPQRVIDISTELGVNPSPALAGRHRLVRKKLIRRSRSTVDRQEVRLSLTPAGRHLVEEVTVRRRRVPPDWSSRCRRPGTGQSPRRCAHWPPRSARYPNGNGGWAGRRPRTQPRSSSRQWRAAASGGGPDSQGQACKDRGPGRLTTRNARPSMARTIAATAGRSMASAYRGHLTIAPVNVSRRRFRRSTSDPVIATTRTPAVDADRESSPTRSLSRPKTLTSSKTRSGHHPRSSCGRSITASACRSTGHQPDLVVELRVGERFADQQLIARIALLDEEYSDGRRRLTVGPRHAAPPGGPRQGWRRLPVPEAAGDGRERVRSDKTCQVSRPRRSPAALDDVSTCTEQRLRISAGFGNPTLIRPPRTSSCGVSGTATIA